MAKIRHNVLRRVFTFSLQFINRHLHNLWYLWLGKFLLILQKRALLDLIYLNKSQEHTVPFFISSNCLPLPSLFFRDCCNPWYNIQRKTAPVSILNQFAKTSITHNYRTSAMSLLFLPHFDVICDLLLNRRTATCTLFVLNIEEKKNDIRQLASCRLTVRGFVLV